MNAGLVLFNLERYTDCAEMQKYVIAKFPDKADMAKQSLVELYDRAAGKALGEEKYVCRMALM